MSGHHILGCSRIAILPQGIKRSMSSNRVQLKQELKNRNQELNTLTKSREKKSSTEPASISTATFDPEESGFELEVREVPNAVPPGQSESDESVPSTVKEFGELDEYEFIDHPGEEVLFQRPWIRQYFIGDKLYRERTERKVTWEELFMDLIYVGVIAKIGLTLKYNLSSLKISEFVLLFIPIWSNWTEVNFMNNVFGGSDLAHKALMLIVVALVAGMGINVKNAFNPDPASHTANVYIATFLTCRAILIVVGSIRMLFIPKFQHNWYIMQSIRVIVSIPWFIGLFYGIEYQMTLWWISSVLDITSQAQSILLAKFGIRLKYRIALNIEHYTERFGLLSIIVIGEVVVNILFDSDAPYLSMGYLATICGLIHAVAFFWLYFNMDASRTYVHAIRRHSVTSVSFSTLHVFLHLSVVSAGVAIGQLISTGSKTLTDNKPGVEMDVKPELRFLYAIGNAVAYFCFFLLGLVHKSRDNVMPWENKPRIPKLYRLCWRFMIGVSFIIVGFVGGHLNPIELLSVGTALGLATILFEVYGSLPKRSLIEKLL
ncbi:bacterial low temperature requirement A protein-domain-containing protein [Paraphysoderma sedebokerense]|nr:bacterial low temperature requirement A protein-domain-containing protein [Paraphysoderma sedebokerense]